MSKAWDIYTYGVKPDLGSTSRVCIDTVWFDDDCDADYVRRSLIDHDGYPSDIEVEPAKD